jgi:hypothetical protein
MERHVKIVAILNIIWGSLGLVGALVVFLIFGSVLGILGTFARSEPAAGLAISIAGAIGSVVLIVILIASIPAIVAGAGLLRFAPWSRMLAIIVSVLHLANLPFGTALGIYGLWTLLSRDIRYLFETDLPPVQI